MKLIYCTECDSVVRLITAAVRSCECGNVKGVYSDDINAIFTSNNENYLLMGFSNPSLRTAMHGYEQRGSPDGWGLNFSAFIIPEPCKTIKRVSSNQFDKMFTSDSD